VTTLDYDRTRSVRHWRYVAGPFGLAKMRAGQSLRRADGPHKVVAVYTYEGLARVVSISEAWRHRADGHS
jgi:hypothetical protein